jgi:hypothetical protein
MPETVTGKFQVVDSNGKPIFTIDPDAGFVQITYAFPDGTKIWEMTNGASSSLFFKGEDVIRAEAIPIPDLPHLGVRAKGDVVAVQGVGSATGKPGVEGLGNGPQGVGVAGIGTGAQGVGVSGNTDFGAATGVHGHTSTGIGVRGTSDKSGPAGSFEGGTGVGLAASTNASDNSAIFGFNGGHGQVPDKLDPPRPAGNGVWGHTTVEKGSGVVGSVEPGLSEAAGVTGLGPIAGKFFGDVEVTGDVHLAKRDPDDPRDGIDLRQKLHEVTTWGMRGTFRAHRIFDFGLSVADGPAGAITSNSIVMASLTEVDSNGLPRSGPTSVTMKVYNVTPRDNEVHVRGEIDSGEDVDFRISVLIANPRIIFDS